eukprot:TRINITY_DN14330_c0_g1_i1.p1 TRINITY_DN14330_c0_g1~~TRINITY_DN14330_c0_g1_i1.p1  ORF type:complete len:675 (+),score=90.57 TRINITY_DN14330_c0_g1_i1:105-2129(+)
MAAARWVVLACVWVDPAVRAECIATRGPFAMACAEYTPCDGCLGAADCASLESFGYDCSCASCTGALWDGQYGRIVSVVVVALGAVMVWFGAASLVSHAALFAMCVPSWEALRPPETIASADELLEFFANHSRADFGALGGGAVYAVWLGLGGIAGLYGLHAGVVWAYARHLATTQAVVERAVLAQAGGGVPAAEEEDLGFKAFASAALPDAEGGPLGVAMAAVCFPGATMALSLPFVATAVRASLRLVFHRDATPGERGLGCVALTLTAAYVIVVLRLLARLRRVVVFRCDAAVEGVLSPVHRLSRALVGPGEWCADGALWELVDGRYGVLYQDASPRGSPRPWMRMALLGVSVVPAVLGGADGGEGDVAAAALMVCGCGYVACRGAKHRVWDEALTGAQLGLQGLYLALRGAARLQSDPAVAAAANTVLTCAFAVMFLVGCLDAGACLVVRRSRRRLLLQHQRGSDPRGASKPQRHPSEPLLTPRAGDMAVVSGSTYQAVSIGASEGERRRLQDSTVSPDRSARRRRSSIENGVPVRNSIVGSKHRPPALGTATDADPGIGTLSPQGIDHARAPACTVSLSASDFELSPCTHASQALRSAQKDHTAQLHCLENSVEVSPMTAPSPGPALRASGMTSKLSIGALPAPANPLKYSDAVAGVVPIDDKTLTATSV